MLKAGVTFWVSWIPCEENLTDEVPGTYFRRVMRLNTSESLTEHSLNGVPSGVARHTSNWKVDLSATELRTWKRTCQAAL